MICFKTLKRRRSLLLCCSGSKEYGHQNARNKEDLYLQWRVFFIIATDFLCWIPTSVFAFWYMLSAHNPQVPEVCDFMLNVSFVLGSLIMVLLPINSALNPLLYTSATRAAIKIWFGSCKRRNLKNKSTLLTFLKHAPAILFLAQHNLCYPKKDTKNNILLFFYGKCSQWGDVSRFASTWSNYDSFSVVFIITSIYDSRAIHFSLVDNLHAFKPWFWSGERLYKYGKLIALKLFCLIFAQPECSEASN